MNRDPNHTSVCLVCGQRTWYADVAITLPKDRDDSPNRPPFVTDPSRWEYGNRSHLHGAPEGTHNLRMIDKSGLAPAFTRYYGTGERIKVEFRSAEGKVYETLTGTVGRTTGWRPVYLLMRRSNDFGSVYTLSDRDWVVAVQRGRKYVSVAG